MIGLLPGVVKPIDGERFEAAPDGDSAGKQVHRSAFSKSMDFAAFDSPGLDKIAASYLNLPEW
jgi:hypothetical protein